MYCFFLHVKSNQNRTYAKHYGSLFPAEITHNQQSGETTFVHFIGGDAYTAPVAVINNENHYLHRDHLGSILAISDSNGTVIEERQFTPWGKVDWGNVINLLKKQG